MKIKIHESDTLENWVNKLDGLFNFLNFNLKKKTKHTPNRLLTNEIFPTLFPP